MFSKLFCLIYVAAAFATPYTPVLRDDCQPCSPQGATGNAPPAMGPDLKSLYIDLLDSVKDIHFQKRWADSSVEKRADGFCCRQTLNCVNVENVNIPMCYDKFTTNYAFPDGSWGSLTTGEYEQSDGSKANLISGEYTKVGGETGDIYADDPEAKPNTATLSIPPQWTASGVGSAIPATELASAIVPMTTIAGLTITTPTVIAGTTVFATISGQTIAVTTIPPRTITTPTVIAPATGVTTSTPITASIKSPSPSSGVAGFASVDPSLSLVVSVFSLLMSALYTW